MTREVVDKSPTVLKQKKVPLILLVWVHGITTTQKKRTFWTSISEPSEFHLSSRMLSLFLGARSGRHKGWIRILDENLPADVFLLCTPTRKKIRMWVFFYEKKHKKSPPTALFFGVKQRVWFEHIETIRGSCA